MRAWRIRRSGAGHLQRAVLLGLVALTLAPSLLGRAGFMAVEQAVAARIIPLHQHGIPGEAAYIRHLGVPAPFVHPHCHAPIDAARSQTPAQLAMGGLLFGPALCGTASSLPPAPAAAFAMPEATGQAVDHGNPRPTTPPPQVLL